MATWINRKKIWKANTKIADDDDEFRVTCCFCEKVLHKADFTIEHIIPQCFCKGKPWKNSIENTKTACEKCNHTHGLILDKEIKEHGKAVIQKRYQAEMDLLDVIYPMKANLRKLLFKQIGLQYKRKFP